MVRPSAFARALAAVIAALAACSGSACSSSDPEALRKATLSGGCNINSDCADPLVCAFRKCHMQCATSRDCPAGDRCMVSDRPYHVCQTIQKCVYNSDCPSGQMCGVDGQCRDQCRTDSDCVQGQLCVQKTCAEPPEIEAGVFDVATPPAESGQTCSYNSDCAAPNVCRDGVCALECKADVDCAVTQRCVANRCATPGPEPAPDAGSEPPPDASGTCSYNSECVAPRVCRSGTCAYECLADVDCGSGQACTGNRCVARGSDGGVDAPPDASPDAPPDTSPDAPPDAPSGYGQTCNLPSDCPAPLRCGLAGQCVHECNATVDCALGLCCFEHACVTGSVCAVLDAGPDASVDASDGSAGEAAVGPPCNANWQCDDFVYCNGAERCYAGRCAPPLDVPCNSHAACIKDICTEATKACSTVTLGVQDGDGDTHLAFACGGDDCDDGDGTVYAGHAELCDGKDNDCNGLIDDYAVVARGAEYASIIASSPLNNRDLITSSFGTGFLTAMLYGGPGNAASLEVRTMSTAGVAGGETVIGQLGVFFTYAHIVGFGANTLPSSSAIVVYDSDLTNQPTTPRLAVAVNATTIDGGAPTYTVSPPITLVPTASGNSQWGGADVDWSPASSSFLVTWTQDDGCQTAGYFTSINPDGSQAASTLPVPTVPLTDGGPPSGHVGLNCNLVPVLRSAVNGAVQAFYYGDSTAIGPGTVYLTSASGSTIAGPISLVSAGTPLEIAAYRSGFVTLSQASDALYMTRISSTGVVLETLKSLAVGSSTVLAKDARGAQDAFGIAFAVKVNGGVRLVRARTNSNGTFDPMEITTPMIPLATGPSDRVDLSVLSDGRLGISYWDAAADNAVHVRIASCLP